MATASLPGKFYDLPVELLVEIFNLYQYKTHWKSAISEEHTLENFTC